MAGGADEMLGAAMRRWLVALVVAMVTSGSAIAINVATDLKHSVGAWVVVAALTLAGAAVTVWVQHLDARSGRQQELAVAEQGPSSGGTRNTIGGDAQGSVVQAGETRAVTMNLGAGSGAH